MLSALLGLIFALAIDQTDPVGFRLDNGVFIADHSRRNGIDSGTLHKLTYKAAGVSLERTPTNWMHWAPSFQRPGARVYTSISTWNPVQKFRRERSGRKFVFSREGRHQDYPEIGLKTEYTYFDREPYFLFHAVLTVENEIDMYWLRGQEMTMDSFFTHAAWPDAHGKPVIRTFETRNEILDRQPIAVDAPWIAFAHPAKGYGYGAVVLDFKATKTAKAMMKINDGANNGKYWDRQIIGQVNTRLVPGDRFEERTAYVLFESTPGNPVGEFLKWEKKLRSIH